MIRDPRLDFIHSTVIAIALFYLVVAMVIFCLVASINVAHASEHMKILRCDGAPNWKECARITISGEITKEDGAEFVERTKEIKTAVVVLSSIGGSFTSGLVIGEQVFAKKFQTRILDNVECISSCANIWLAGKTRSAGIGSVLVFHSPYDAKDPTHADGTASVMEGIYLARLGYSYRQATALFSGHGPMNAKAYVVNAEGIQQGFSCDTDTNGETSCKP